LDPAAAGPRRRAQGVRRRQGVTACPGRSVAP
jgi:hypothetical protein